MTIDCYTVCWNEEVFLPYFLRHYQHYCRSITVFDNESTDNSRRICEDFGATVIPWKTSGLDNAAMRALKNSCWKDSTADYVIVCDVDEIIVGLEKLTPCPGRIIRCLGIQMVGQEGERPEQIRNGFIYSLYNKCAVFSPRISEIGFYIGCHKNTPVGYKETVELGEGCELLHFSLLSEESVIARWKQYALRRGASDRENNWAAQYGASEDAIRESYRDSLKQAQKLPDWMMPRF